MVIVYIKLEVSLKHKIFISQKINRVQLLVRKKHFLN